MLHNLADSKNMTSLFIHQMLPNEASLVLKVYDTRKVNDLLNRNSQAC